MGLKALRKIQIGEESTAGNAVAATAALAGNLTMKETPIIHRPEEARGSLITPYRSVKVGNLAELSFEGDCTFEQLLYWLHCGIQGGVTPTGAGSEKTWTFTPAKTAAGTYDTFTIEYGDEVQAWETEYCMVKTLEIAGAMGEPITVKAELFGRKMTETTFTGSLSIPAVETAITQMAKLYIDDEDGTIGTTEKSNTLISFTYKIETGILPVRYGDGSYDFSGYTETGAKAELQATFAFNSGANTERANYDGSTQRLIRIAIEGSTIDVGSKEINLDICGAYQDWSTLEDREGEDVVTVTLSSEDSPNYGKGCEIKVVNDVTSLP